MSILIVDDNESFRRSLRRLLLTLYPSHRIHEAATGEESISMARANPPDLVIMDIGMPGMNGIEAAGIIRQELPLVPMVVLSVHEEDCCRREAAAAGVSEYVPKFEANTRLVRVLATLLAD